jgi:NADH dehydrogenase FAD-containing subunit
MKNNSFLNVEILPGRLVSEYDGEQVRLSDGELISAATLIWASGVIAREVKRDCAGIGIWPKNYGRKFRHGKFN